jgi:rubrerythrin
MEAPMRTLLDIFKLALFNEVKAQLFYRIAAEISEGDEARMWFIELSGLEEDHAHELVQRMEESSQLEGFNGRPYLRELQASTASWLRLDEVRMFRQGGIEAVLRYAREMEAQSRENYLAMADRIDDPELRGYLRSLAAEEQRHHDEIRRIEETLGVAVAR